MVASQPGVSEGRLELTACSRSRLLSLNGVFDSRLSGGLARRREYCEHHCLRHRVAAWCCRILDKPTRIERLSRDCVLRYCKAHRRPAVSGTGILRNDRAVVELGAAY